MLVPNLNGSISEFINGKAIAFAETIPAPGEYFKHFGEVLRRRCYGFCEANVHGASGAREKLKYSFKADPNRFYRLNANAHPKRGEQLSAGHRTPAVVLKARRARGGA